MSGVPVTSVLRCAGCRLFSFDLVDGQCGQCRKGKRPMTPAQVEFVRDQAKMRAEAQTARVWRADRN